MIPGTRNFDKKANGGTIVVLRNDNSVSGIPIDPAGKLTLLGLDFLDPRQPYWHGKAPDVRWPK